MVSPTYKGGFGASHIEAVAQDGESVAFFSPGSFAGVPAGFSGGLDNVSPYLARRGSFGWFTEPIMPPAVLTPAVPDRDESPTLSATIALGKPGQNAEWAFQMGAEEEFLLNQTGLPDIAGNWEVLGGVLKTLTEVPIVLHYEGASEDFCHLFFINVTDANGEKDPLLAEARGTLHPLYELTRGCGGEPVELRLVALDNKGNVFGPSCGAEVGITTYGRRSSAFNAIAAEGEEVFLTTCIGNSLSHHQLFVRLAGSRTLEVSKQLEGCTEVPCVKAVERANSDFVGASEDGSHVYFSTTAPLTGDKEDVSNNLYVAKIGCPEGEPECQVAERSVTSLSQVSHDPSPGGMAGVQGTVKVTRDGSRIYFVATGDLLDEAQRRALESETRPVPRAGADNLYVYDAVTGVTTFVADLCSGPEASGSMEDKRCPNPKASDAALWSAAGSEAQAAGPEGRFLVFSTYAQLVKGDTDNARDVYRYDVESGALERVSTGEDGYSENGNREDAETEDNDAGMALTSQGGGSVRTQHELSARAVSEDGSRIVFTTSEALSPAAVNGLANVYEWHEKPGGDEGEVTLVSGGSGETPVEDVVIAPQGRDILFVTSQGLLPQDTDGEPDIYDARISGGFPSAPASREPCSSDACQGPLTNPAPLLVPGSASQAPEDLPPSKPAVKKARKSRAPAKKRRRKARRVGHRLSRVGGAR